MNAPDSFVAHFREAAPYIRQMRGTTLVAGIDGRLLEGGTLNKLAADIGLLSQLGIRLVLIHGAYHFLDRLAAAQGRTPHYAGVCALPTKPRSDRRSSLPAPSAAVLKPHCAAAFQDSRARLPSRSYRATS